MKSHYEKVITFCCFLFLFVNIGFPSTSFNVYQPYLIAQDAVGDLGASAILAVRTLVSLCAMFFVDRYYSNLDARRGVALACAMTAAGFGLYAVGGSMPVYLLGAVLSGMGYGFGGMVAMTILTNRWYRKGIGTAMGVASVGSGVASILVPLAAVQVIHAQSLHAAFALEAGVALGLGALVLLLLRNRPSDLGIELEDPALEGGTGRPVRAPYRLSPAWRALFMGALVAVGAVAVGGGTYLSVLFTSSGIDAVFAATLLSVMGICLTIAKFVTGRLFDAIGTRRGSALMFGVLTVGLALCIVSSGGSPVIAAIAAALLGAGISLGTVGISMWSLELTDGGSTTRFVKRCQIAYALGGFLMNSIPGPLKTITGTYVSSYAIMCAITVYAGIVVVAIYRARKAAMN
ncbi:MAG: MFS transporter [Eggerthellaceae bacterium]|jgi:MFS family permease|nr:MFS transporter [Eggerthellaceae bacterium]